MTMLDSVAPGVCGCGRVASEPHACEYRPAARTLRVCECGEFTYSATCGPCRLPEPPPMPDTAVRTTARAWSPPPDNRPGYVWVKGQRVRVPIPHASREGRSS